MAMTPLGNGGDDLVPLAEINITPFVDVVLVLLIVFMVAAPLMTASVPVELPASAQASQPQPSEPLVLSVGPAGEVWLQDEPVAAADLPGRLAGLRGEDGERVVYLRGDKDVAYGRLMAVMEVVQAAGFTKVALATQPKGG